MCRVPDSLKIKVTDLIGAYAAVRYFPLIHLNKTAAYRTNPDRQFPPGPEVKNPIELRFPAGNRVRLSLFAWRIREVKLY